MSGSQRETPKIDRARRRARPQEWVAKPKVGDTLGSFRLLQLLGEGGAGVVYRAEHSFLKRPVAIKILHPELYLRPAMVARFFHEALAVNRARHKNIIDITDVVASEGFPPFIVMELLVGEDLGDHIDQHAPLGLTFTVEVARQICDALAVVHRLEMVHRDLKPENIFLSRGGDDDGALPAVKLLDFGIAKFIDSEENRRRTWSGNILGTPAYMPLEQLHGLPVDHRADIYALGVVLYEMLTRHLPFEIEGLDDLADGKLHREPPAPSVRAGRQAPEPIPPGVDAVVLRCLADSPAKRFQSVKELSDALVEAAREAVTEGKQPASAVAVSRRRPAQLGSRVDRSGWPGAAQGEASDAATSVEEALRRRMATTPPDSPAALPRIPTPPEGAGEAPGTPAMTLEGEARRGYLGLGPLLGVVAGLAAVGLVVGLSFTWGTGEGSKDRGAGPTSQSARPFEPRPSAQSIALESEPTHARIHRADTDALLGETPTRVPVSEGRPQVLVLRKVGFQETRVTLRSDGPDPIRIRLDPEPAPPREVDPSRGIPDAAAAPPAPRPLESLAGMRPRGTMDAAPPRRPAGATPQPRVTEHGIVDPFPM